MNTTLADFNTGASVPDTEANGPNGQSITEWRRKRGIDLSQQIRVVRLVHMRYQHPDLKSISTFLHDFGMRAVKETGNRVWFRGYGIDQYVYYAQKGPKKFLGGTFEVETYDDLIKASKLNGAGAIESLDDAPGGGSLVTAFDPEGLPINFIHGQEPAKTGKMPEKLDVNFEADKPRRRKFLRFDEGPAAVHKVGTHPYKPTFDWMPTNENNKTAWSLRPLCAEFC